MGIQSFTSTAQELGHGSSIYINIADGSTAVEELEPGCNYAIVDATGVRSTAPALTRLHADVGDKLLNAAEQVTVVTGALDRLEPHIFYTPGGLEGMVTLALPSSEAVDPELWGDLVRETVEILRVAFSGRANGVRWVWFGRDEFSVYEDPEQEQGVTTIEIHGPRRLQTPSPASEPAVFPQDALRAAIRGCGYACVVTPDAEGTLPADRIVAHATACKRSVGVHSDPRSIGGWIDFLHSACSDGAITETFGAAAADRR